jgi:hypothetical protein
MTSYEFDSFQADTNYLTLYKSTFCGITCGTARKYLIQKHNINFIIHGRYFNKPLAVFAGLLFFFGIIARQQDFYFASFVLTCYCLYMYINSNLVISSGNVYFTSTCCTNHENLLEWFNGKETGSIEMTRDEKGYTHVV